MVIKYARLYVSRREKPDMTPYEASVRVLSYALKEGNPQACAIAALAMGGKIRVRRCLLVPVPDSNGRTFKNLELCGAIHRHKPGAVILNLLQGFPRESQCQRADQRDPWAGVCPHSAILNAAVQQAVPVSVFTKALWCRSTAA